MLKPFRPRLATAAAALVGAALLVGPAGASAQTAAATQTAPAPAAVPLHHHYYRHHMAAKTPEARRETLEDRISTLHTELNITLAEETAWTPVAQTMRDNEANMQKLIAARRAEAGHDQTAVEDLRTYEQFTQAHVDGLKSLISSFETLYSEMPSSQQAVADHVFKYFGHHDRAMKS
jgi:hypothetical protein